MIVGISWTSKVIRLLLRTVQETSRDSMSFRDVLSNWTFKPVRGT